MVVKISSESSRVSLLHKILARKNFAYDWHSISKVAAMAVFI